MTKKGWKSDGGSWLLPPERLQDWEVSDMTQGITFFISRQKVAIAFLQKVCKQKLGSWCHSEPVAAFPPLLHSSLLSWLRPACSVTQKEETAPAANSLPSLVAAKGITDVWVEQVRRAEGGKLEKLERSILKNSWASETGEARCWRTWEVGGELPALGCPCPPVPFQGSVTVHTLFIHVLGFSGVSGRTEKVKLKAGLSVAMLPPAGLFSTLMCHSGLPDISSPSRLLCLYQPTSHLIVMGTVYTNTLVQRFHCLVIVFVLHN